MTFILIIYIYIDLTNFVNVTMNYYRHVLFILCYYMYSWMYDVTELNRCLTSTVSKDRKASNGLTSETGVHTCIEYQVTQPSFSLVCYTDRYDILYTFCQCILYTVHILSVYTIYCTLYYNCIIKLYYIR